MKRKFIYISVMVLLGNIFSSCEDFLNKEPISQLTNDKFWKTEQDANVGVIAIYSTFSRALAAGIWNWGELRGDNFTGNGKTSFDQDELINNTIPNDNPAGIWTNLYEAISKANAAIKYIPRIEMEATLKDHYLGEAYAMRALCYFYCVRVWGDVPVFLEPLEEYSAEEIYRTRTDKDKILEDIILNDLEQAYNLIKKTYSTSASSSESPPDRTRMNVASVCALHMDVLAWMHDYNAVVKIKEERVNNLQSTFWSMTKMTVPVTSTDFQAKWRAMFIENPLIDIPNEVFFKLTYDRYGNGVNQSVSYFGNSTSHVYISNYLLNAYKEGIVDKRYETGCQWVKAGSEDPVPFRFRRKFWKDDAVWSSTPDKEQGDNDLVIYRYADIVLLYAEALNELGNPYNAVEQLNITRTRAGNPPYNSTVIGNKDDILKAILNERQREFVGEGKRWFDLVRTGKWKEVMGPINGISEEWQLLFPIHRQHLIENYKLKQNYGYQGI